MTLKTQITALVLLTASCLNVYAYEEATVLYSTNPPIPQLGFDVSDEQTVAIRFSPTSDAILDSIELWFMNNAIDIYGEVTVSLTTDNPRDDGHSEPSQTVLESWTFNITSSGWQVEKEILYSELTPYLEAEQRYWLTAQSSAFARKNPVWNIAGPDGDDHVLGYYGRLDPRVGVWEVGPSAIPNVRVLGE